MISQPFEHLTGNLADDRLIFGHQDGFIPSGMGSHHRGGNRIHFFSSGCRKADSEGAACSHFTLEPDITAMLPDNAIHSRQTQPGPFAKLLGGKKRFKNP